jgi:hypothetical protein
VNNKFTFTLPENDQYINLPVEIKWDFNGKEDSIELYEEDVVKEIIGVAEDFEVLRFSHASYSSDTKTDVKYDFHFYSGDTTDISNSTPSNWVCSYIPEGFTKSEVYYYSKPFTKSFFKLDFYDTNNPKSQTNYFTVIIPVQQGNTESVSLTPYKPNVNIRIPSYNLDYVGDKEGFFLYWLRKKQFIDLNTFYMTAKFFDGRLGVYVKMMTEPQSTLTQKFTFEGSKYFYRKVVLDYETKEYKIYDNLGTRIGTDSPIKWYEYINP